MTVYGGEGFDQIIKNLIWYRLKGPYEKLQVFLLIPLLIPVVHLVAVHPIPTFTPFIFLRERCSGKQLSIDWYPSNLDFKLRNARCKTTINEEFLFSPTTITRDDFGIGR